MAEWAYEDLMAWLERWPDDWRLHAFRAIQEIPPGSIATYGAIAELVNERHGHTIIARNVAWLRSELYGWVRGGDEAIRSLSSSLPLHRVAKAGDVMAHSDSVRTGKECRAERRKEGSLAAPRWWTG